MKVEVNKNKKKKKKIRTMKYREYVILYIKGCLPQILLGPFLNNLAHKNEVNDESAYRYRLEGPPPKNMR